MAAAKKPVRGGQTRHATPQQQPPQNSQSLQVTAQHVEFQGPIPPPEILSKYDLVQPGFAERIVKMAEAEQQHRHTIETTVVSESFVEAKRGQLYGLLIGIIAIIAGALASVAGAPIPGAIIGGGGVIGLVSVFVLGRFFPTGKPEN